MCSRIVSVFLSLASCSVSETVRLESFSHNGETYNDCVLKVSSSSKISVMHSAGIFSVPVSEISPALAEKLGIKPATKAESEKVESKFAEYKYLGVIPNGDHESKPAVAINEMIQESPQTRIFVLTGVVHINGGKVKDSYKWFYDRKDKILVMMRRTSMQFVDDSNLWRIWHDVSPSDFSKTLPYMDEKIKSTPSPYKNPVEAFPIKYTEDPDVTKWP